ncbi:helix-turn-helix domain-containing protein [Sphingomonas sp. HITSZ_GF]|uniref:helix-turn-helix domain-containing protein n=1 Tax=Sphingomonas sp. HITSZ_GF TaxID=3037247 RepID=UPI00240DCF31|nr:helix-turn-helix domain-containing protein [Sphingomonas sp. HITSZ_GF]MDG2533912.1 helix-turn-helix domain-containing protein [Sphingomonas sp. HITSZ_GF]
MHAPLRFSTDSLPARTRTEAWRALYGREILNVALDPVGEQPFACRFSAHAAGRVAFVRGETSGAVFAKTPDLAGGDELLLIVHGRRHGAVEQCGRRAELAPGDAALLHSAELGRSIHPHGVDFLNIRLPGAELAERLPGVHDRLARTLPALTPALMLLARYTRLVEQLPPSEGLGNAVADHICDLAVLALGALPDPETRASAGAARLALVQADIRRNAWRPELSIGWAAARQGISAVYLRKLFAAAGTSFADFVLAVRLDQARARLADPAWSHRTIATIAFEIGFGDISYFNRCFRRRFGMTPSESRALG